MPRTAPSVAVQQVVTTLAGRGVNCTARQIEEWVRKGLVPKPEQRWVGGGGSVAALPERFEAWCELVASLPRHQRTTGHVALAAFQSGFPVDEQMAVQIRNEFVQLFDEIAAFVLEHRATDAPTEDATAEAAASAAAQVVAEQPTAVKVWAANVSMWQQDLDDPELAERPVAETVEGLLGVFLAGVAGDTSDFESATAGWTAAVGGLKLEAAHDPHVADQQAEITRTLVEGAASTAAGGTAEELESVRDVVETWPFVAHLDPHQFVCLVISLCTGTRAGLLPLEALRLSDEGDDMAAPD